MEIETKYGKLEYSLGGVEGDDDEAPISLDSIIIKLEYRGQGKGRELIEELKKIAREKGVGIEGLASQIDDVPVEQLRIFYENCGFDIEYRDEYSFLIRY